MKKLIFSTLIMLIVLTGCTTDLDILDNISKLTHNTYDGLEEGFTLEYRDSFNDLVLVVEGSDLSITGILGGDITSYTDKKIEYKDIDGSKTLSIDGVVSEEYTTTLTASNVTDKIAINLEDILVYLDSGKDYSDYIEIKNKDDFQYITFSTTSKRYFADVDLKLKYKFGIDNSTEQEKLVGSVEPDYTADELIELGPEYEGVDKTFSIYLS